MNLFKNIKNGWIWIEENFLTLIIIVMGIDILAQIITRKIFNYPFSFTEELARNLQIWLTFLGAGLCFRRNEMIRMEVVYNKFPDRIRPFIDILIYGFMLWVSFMLVIPSWKLAMDQMRIVWDTVPGLSLGIVYISEPIGFSIISIYLIGRIAKSVEVIFISFKGTRGGA